MQKLRRQRREAGVASTLTRTALVVVALVAALFILLGWFARQPAQAPPQAAAGSVASEPAIVPPPLGPNLLRNPSFETPGIDSWYEPWRFSIEAAGTARGYLVRDTGVAGRVAARIDVTAADSDPNNAWYVAFWQGDLSITAGVPVTVSFRARASRNRVVTLAVNQNYSPFRFYYNSPALILTTAWQQVTYTFVPTASDTNVRFSVDVAQSTGSVWLDDLTFAVSSTERPASPPAEAIYLGVSQHPAPWDMTALDRFRQDSGRGVAILHYFVEFQAGAPPERAVLEAARAAGTVPMITWEWLQTNLAGVLSGAYDADARLWAATLRDYGQPVLLRWGHEMNGIGWYPWGVNLTDQTPEQYVAAWRRLREIFRREGADNVQFVWSPNIREGDATDFTNFYPGDGYVDWLALDGYNFATKYRWRSFTELFRDSYDAITALSNKPLMIAEWGSTEQGGDKGVWLHSALTQEIPGAFPRIRAVVYFNQLFREDWRIETSERSRAGYAAGIAPPIYRDVWP